MSKEMPHQKVKISKVESRINLNLFSIFIIFVYLFSKIKEKRIGFTLHKAKKFMNPTEEFVFLLIHNCRTEPIGIQINLSLNYGY